MKGTKHIAVTKNDRIVNPSSFSILNDHYYITTRNDDQTISKSVLFGWSLKNLQDR